MLNKSIIFSSNKLNDELYQYYEKHNSTAWPYYFINCINIISSVSAICAYVILVICLLIITGILLIFCDANKILYFVTPSFFTSLIIILNYIFLCVMFSFVVIRIVYSLYLIFTHDKNPTRKNKNSKS
jgi:hypothetical protein